MEVVYYYSYDNITGEYIGKGIADINPVATQKAGKNVYYAPAYSTLDEPPELPEHKVALFENGKWIVKDDFRGCFICDKNLNLVSIQEIGAIPDGYYLITDKQAQKIKDDFYWYILKDGKLVKNPNYEECKEQQKRERLAKFSMTKYDFFKFVCQPNEIDYTTLKTLIQSNDEIAVAWDLCGRIYRGDTTLCKYIKDFLPDITDEILDTIFEEHGKIINE